VIVAEWVIVAGPQRRDTRELAEPVGEEALVGVEVGGGDGTIFPSVGSSLPRVRASARARVEPGGAGT